MKNLHEILREKTIEYYTRYCKKNMKQFDMLNLFYRLFYDVDNWPKLTFCFDCGIDKSCTKCDLVTEDLDMENNGILEITNNSITISCGGDWQEPKTMTIKSINDRLSVVDNENGYDDGIYWNKKEKFFKDINLDLTKI